MGEKKCEPTDLSKVNPKTFDPRGRSQGGAFRFSSPASPIPAQIEDPQDMLAFFSAFREVLIPYAGTALASSHSLLYFLLDMVENSPTQGAVINSMLRHAFGGKVEIVRSYDPVFRLQTEEDRPDLSPQEELEFHQFVTEQMSWHLQNNRLSNVRDVAQSNFRDLAATGNCWIELVLVSRPTPMVHVHVHPVPHVLHIKVAKGEAPAVAISPIWNDIYLKKNPPTVLPIFPVYAEQDGVFRTMFQVMTGDYPYYGRPNSIGSLLWQFREFQDADYLVKETMGRFMGDALVEYEDDNYEFADDDLTAGEEGYQNVAEKIEREMTNKSDDPQRFIVVSRPAGAGPMFVYQFKPHAGQEWFESQADVAERKIIRSHGWSKRFMGDNEASGLSTNVYLDEFEIKAATDLLAWQEMIGALHNTIIAEAADFLGRQDLWDRSIRYSSPFAEMLRQRLESMQNQDNATPPDPDQSVGSNPT